MASSNALSSSGRIIFQVPDARGRVRGLSQEATIPKVSPGVARPTDSRWDTVRRKARGRPCSYRKWRTRVADYVKSPGAVRYLNGGGRCAADQSSKDVFIRAKQGEDEAVTRRRVQSQKGGKEPVPTEPLTQYT